MKSSFGGGWIGTMRWKIHKNPLKCSQDCHILHPAARCRSCLRRKHENPFLSSLHVLGWDVKGGRTHSRRNSENKPVEGNYCEKSLLMFRITAVMVRRRSLTHSRRPRDEELAENKTKFDRNLVFLDFSSFAMKNPTLAPTATAQLPSPSRESLRGNDKHKNLLSIPTFVQALRWKFCFAEILSRNFALGAREVWRKIGVESSIWQQHASLDVFRSHRS